MEKTSDLRSLTREQWLLFIVATLMWISVKSGQFMMKTHGLSLSADTALVAKIVGISGLVGFLLRFPLGIFGDWIYNKMLLIKLSLLTTIGGAVLFLLSPTPGSLYIYNLCMGVTICSWILFNVIFTNIYRRQNIIMSVAVLAIANNIGSYVAPIVAGQLIHNTVVDGKVIYDFSGRHNVIFSLALMVLAFILSNFIKEDRINVKFDIGLKELAKNIFEYRLAIVSIFGMIVTFIKYSTLKYSFETLVHSLGGTTGAIGNIDANYDLLHVIGGLMAGRWLVKKIGHRYTVALGTFIMSASIFLAPVFGSLNAFLIFNLLAGFGMGVAYITLMSMSIIDADPKFKNTRMGFFQSVYMLGIYYAPQVCNYIETTMHADKFMVYNLNAYLGFASVAIILFTFRFLRTDK